MAPDQFEMHHPESGGVAVTTEQQFVEVWEPRGWVRSDPEAATEAPVEDAPPEPESASAQPAKAAKRGSSTETRSA